MPQNPNDILALLMGGGQTIDPRAQFMMQNFQALPGDPTSNYNTILDLLSPSATQDYAERMGGPQALGQTFGLSPTDTESFIRQTLGLEMSPLQQQAGQVDLLKLLPQFLGAEAAGRQAGAAERTAGVREREATVSEQEAGVKVSTEARLREQFEKGTPQDRATIYEMNLKNIALTGTMLDGTKVDKDVRQNAYALLRGTQSMPGLSALVAQLARDEEWEAAGRLVGLPPDSIKKTWLSGVLVSSKGAEAAQQSYGLAPQETEIDMDKVNKQIQSMQESFQKNFWSVVEKAKEQ